MKKEGKRWNTDQKIRIVKESSTKGVRETLEKYGVYPATFYAWKRKFDQMGKEGFAHGMTKERLAKIKELEQEVELLKQLLAEENYKEAILIFELLNTTTQTFTQEINWYLSLAYLLDHNSTSAKKQLSEIDIDDWNYNKAQKLIRAIK